MSNEQRELVQLRAVFVAAARLTKFLHCPDTRLRGPVTLCAYCGVLYPCPASTHYRAYGPEPPRDEDAWEVEVWQRTSALVGPVDVRLADSDVLRSDATEVNLIDYVLECALEQRRVAEEAEMGRMLGVGQ